MASEASGLSQPVSSAGSTGAAIIARLDRIPIWSLSYLFIGIIGIGFLFTFFDIFDINVSFIQTCVQIVPGCTPPTAANYLGLPVLLNLFGYIVGALILSPLADRFGRRDMLLVATYISEVAPSNGRAKYTSLIFVMSSLGAFLGIWLGLLLTTPATPFPLGLPFALAGPGFENGWRWMYGIGALLALVGILLRFQLPESPRWLITRGRLDEANQIVTSMEQRAMRRLSQLPPVGSEMHVNAGEMRITYVELLSNPMYLRRTIVLFLMWFVAFITVYGIGVGLTTILVSLGYPPPEAGLIAALQKRLDEVSP